jgi:hypothetical protein
MIYIKLVICWYDFAEAESIRESSNSAANDGEKDWQALL